MIQTLWSSIFRIHTIGYWLTFATIFGSGPHPPNTLIRPSLPYWCLLIWYVHDLAQRKWEIELFLPAVFSASWSYMGEVLSFNRQGEGMLVCSEFKSNMGEHLPRCSPFMHPGPKYPQVRCTNFGTGNLSQFDIQFSSKFSPLSSESGY